MSTFRLPIPRKGIETRLRVRLSGSVRLTFRLPIPRKGIETDISLLASPGSCTLSAYLFPVRGLKH